MSEKVNEPAAPPTKYPANMTPGLMRPAVNPNALPYSKRPSTFSESEEEQQRMQNAWAV